MISAVRMLCFGGDTSTQQVKRPLSTCLLTVAKVTFPVLPFLNTA